MKSILVSIVASVVLVGCGEAQQSAPAPEAKPAEPVAEATKPTTPPKAVTANKGADPARGAKPEPPTVKAPDIDIHLAIKFGNIEAVKQHLAAGADVEVVSSRLSIHGGWTLLQHAAAVNDKEMVELLIAEGADVNAVDDFRRTPLDRASGKEIADILRKHGGKTAGELKAEGK